MPVSPVPPGVTVREFVPGDVIFRQDDDPREEAFLIHAGRVEIRRRVRGTDRVVRVLNRGEILGELALFRGTAHSASAIALEPVTLLVVPAGRLHRLVRTSPALAVALIRQLALRLREAEGLAEASRDRPRRGRPSPPSA